MMILSEKDLQLLSSMSNTNITSEADSSFKDNELKIEFDGTTVLCRVCGDRASGFHYGVHSCEGCKGFFRRSIQQKIQYRPCTKNQQCSILRINRNRCQYCRLKKCIAVGMSRDAVRFGRVPKREKAKILAAMQKVNANCQEKQLAEQLEDENRLLVNILQAHEETCDYIKEKVVPFIEKARANPVYARCPSSMACPLNPLPPAGMENGGPGNDGVLEDLGERFSPAIRGVVEFAKRIPGFSMLSQDDQVTLLKAGVFEVLLVRLACMFDKSTNSMICLNGMVLQRESLHAQSNARFLLDSMFTFAEGFNSLNLSDSEIALFSAIIVISPDRPGLHNIDLVDKINRKCVDLLDKSIKSNHHSSSTNPGLIFNSLINKIADLRTLNTLHSEKLLTYKMGPKNGQNYENLSSSSPLSTSSSSSSSSSLALALNHNGNSNSSSNDRNCGSPASINTTSTTCSYASLLPVQWQNFTIRDTNDGPTSSSSSSSSSSSTMPYNNNSYGSNEDEGLSSSSGSSIDRNSVTSSDNVLNAKSTVITSANGSDANNNTKRNTNIQYQHNNQQNGSDAIATHFILGQRLLQASNNNNNNNNTNNTRDKKNGLKENLSNSICRYQDHHQNQHQHQQHQQHLQSYHSNAHQDNYSYSDNSNKKCNTDNDVYSKMRRVDSPTDSGIESGKEQCNGSTPTTSVCSSPRSACDDKVKDIVSDSECSISEKANDSIDDMPMLKRALQAPPLINTNMLMDEAYRHHKKFRATKASRDCEPASSSTSICSSLAPSPLNNNHHHHHHHNNNIVNSSSSNDNGNNHSLASPTSTSSSLSSSTSSLSSSSSSSCLSSSTSNNNINNLNGNHNNCDSLASSHSTLIKVLEQAPRYIGDLSPRHLSSSSSSTSSSPSPSHSNHLQHLRHHLINSSSSSPSHTPFISKMMIVDDKGEGRQGDSMPPPLDLSRKRDLLYL